ncbi:MAG: hypothetical protein KC441_19785, partial [Anaerolineales bacterium]|nr:hypothetical protein [Anaerolineales bacterium]
MTAVSTSPPASDRSRRRFLFLILALGLLANFVCIFVSFWLALWIYGQSDAVNADMLAQSAADYGRDTLIFAPLDPAIIEQAATDAARLALTLTPASGDNGDDFLSPVPIIQFPTARPTENAPNTQPTATSTQPPTATPGSTA